MASMRKLNAFDRRSFMARLDIALTPPQGIMEEIRYFHPDGTPFRDGVCYGMPFEDFHTRVFIANATDVR